MSILKRKNTVIRRLISEIKELKAELERAYGEVAILEDEVEELREDMEAIELNYEVSISESDHWVRLWWEQGKEVALDEIKTYALKQNGYRLQ